jgi:hypothetical protein
MGKHPSTVENRVRISRVLQPFADGIYETPLEDQERELLRLSRADAEQIPRILEMLSLGRAKNVSEAIGLLDLEKGGVVLESRGSGEVAIPDVNESPNQECLPPPATIGDGSIPPLEKEAISIDADSNCRVEVLIDPSIKRRFDAWVRRHGYSVSIEETMRKSFIDFLERQDFDFDKAWAKLVLDARAKVLSDAGIMRGTTRLTAE